MGHIPYVGARRAWLATLGLAIAGAAVLMLDLPRARAGDLETRYFTITVDGKKAGDYQLTIQRAANGAVAVFAQSNVRVTVLAVPVYTYSYRAQEVWKDGRLGHFDSNGQEKGKDFAVRVDADGQELRVLANGKERRIQPDVWTTSCWCLPDARFRNNELTLLGCDSGASYRSRLQSVGTETITIAGQSLTCTHYRVTKDVPHDLWYDAQERLVRDEWMSSGHRTVVELTSVRR